MNINVSYNHNALNKAANSNNLNVQNIGSSFEQGLALFNNYSKYFPTRSGEATNLGYTVEHPSYESFSAAKNLNEVAKDARNEINSQYNLMAASGKPFDYNSLDGVDRNELFKNFDRRALFAVASNEGAAFTKQEQDMASSIMSSQLALASGFYSGPSRLQNEYRNNANNSHIAQADAMLNFLNSVSEEEKNSSKWMLEMVGAENLKNSSLKESSKPKNDEFGLIRTMQSKEFAKNNQINPAVNYNSMEVKNNHSFAISA